MIGLLFVTTERKKAQDRKASMGFTLAELLISLAILGVIATFTIPKILSAQQNNKQNANAHEVAAMISAAYTQHKFENKLTASTTPGSLTPYMNYVSVDTSTTVDDIPSFNNNLICGSNVSCIKLHSGGVLFHEPAQNFAGTGATNAIHFWFDPDGIRGTSGTADSPGKAMAFVLYYNGQLTSRALVKPGTVTSSHTMNPGAYDPSWFSW